MSAKTESISAPIPASEKRQRIPTAVKIIAVAAVPFFVFALSLFLYGRHVQNAAQVYPNIYISGIDVSGLTQSEAMEAIGVSALDESIDNTSVTLVFPDETEIVISGHDVDMQHNARELVAEAYSVGRGRGMIMDVISYMQQASAYETEFNIYFSLNADMLTSIVNEATEAYNITLDGSVPEIHEDRIIFTKGAGHINANELRIFDFVYESLFTSLESGASVEVIYSLYGHVNIVCELWDLRNEVFTEAVSSVFDPETNAATYGSIGVDFDPIAVAAYIGNLEPGETTEIVFDRTYPEYTQEQLQSLLFRDLIGERTTYNRGSEGRLTNVRLSSEAIDGLILLPGEEFSFNRVVGRRTAARGFQLAPIIVNGEFRPGMGGGICQTASTIFAAVRPTDLRVTERRAHSLPVAYLPPGWDAAVAWGHIDFRFVNNTNYPLRLDLTLVGRHLTVEIWGTIVDDFPRAADWNS